MSVLSYFAYGSNLHPLRLRRRVPSSQAVAVAALEGYRLCFHKRGRDGSGKCNILPTGRAVDRVIGVVYTMAAAEKPLLDEIEGLGCGYDEATLPVVGTDGGHMVFCYRAQPGYIDDTLKPFSWYKALVLGGCRVHGLPLSYVRRIERVETIEDPDPARSELHRRILETCELIRL